jgi:hypothetical protein
MQFLGDGDEVTKMPKFEVLIHTSNIIIGINKILDVMNRGEHNWAWRLPLDQQFRGANELRTASLDAGSN